MPTSYVVDARIWVEVTPQPFHQEAPHFRPLSRTEVETARNEGRTIDMGAYAQARYKHFLFAGDFLFPETEAAACAKASHAQQRAKEDRDALLAFGKAYVAAPDYEQQIAALGWR